MKKIQYYLSLAVILTTLTACVPKKKYQEMSTLKKRTQEMLDKRNKEIEKLKDEMAKLQADKNDCEDARTALEQDTTALAAKLRESDGELGALKASCKRVEDNYEQLKLRSTEKMRDLVRQLEGLQGDLAQREARLRVVEGRLQQRDSLMNSLRTRLADALLGFKKDGLTVDIKNGKVYVSLSNKLLFASGSTSIDENGQRALSDLAGILKDQEDITIMVEGHTDDVPVSNLGRIKDNWDLSVMRSTEVVRLLVENGVPNTRVIPAGRSEFIPKVAEKTTEARAANRRTEIIISPRLDALYDLIGQN